MDLQQIGMYIAMKRKEQGLTQEELAKRLHVTNKAVSNGKMVNVCLIHHIMKHCVMHCISR